MRELQKLIARLSPPGYSTTGERRTVIAGSIIAALLAVYYYLVRIDWFTMGNPPYFFPYFVNMYRGCMVAFVILATVCLLFAIPRLVYCCADSRSDYLLRRLPRRELWLRCVAGPVLLALLVLTFALALAFVNLIIYYILAAATGSQVKSDQIYMMFKVWAGYEHPMMIYF